jgi:CubicO group peptidase (beta-lactamase class C family)
MYGRLRNAVELAAGAPFSEYCHNAVLPSAGIINARLTSAVEDEIEPQPNTVLGHSVLGSPMRPTPGNVPGSFESAVAMRASARDLAQLIAVVLDDEPSALEVPGFSAANAVDFAAQLDQLVAGGLALAFDVHETSAGPRVQVMDGSAGVICLMRWYPSARAGVVVLCNSADVIAAAERLAHIALGGE